MGIETKGGEGDDGTLVQWNAMTMVQWNAMP